MASIAFSVVALLAAVQVRAESHTVTFDNKCGKGTPQLILGGKVVSTGQPYTSQGVLSGIAYLQTGECGFNGDNCGLMEMTLTNPAAGSIGSGSSTDISLIPDHKLNVPIAFEYQNGCAGKGQVCMEQGCNTAFYVPDDNQVQVQCQDENVDLLITFCPSGSGSSPSSSSSKASSTSSTQAAPTSSIKASSSAKVLAPSSSSSSAAQPTASANKSQCSTRKSGARRRATGTRRNPSDGAEELYVRAMERAARTPQPDPAADADSVARALRAHRRHTHH